MFTKVVVDATKVVADRTEGKVDTVDGVVDATKVVVDATKVVADRTEGKVDTVDGVVDATKVVVDATKVVADRTEGKVDTVDGVVDATKVVVDATKVVADRTEGKVDNVDADLVAVDNVLDAGIADLKALVQRNKGIAFTGTASDVAAAMTGVTGYAGGITLTTAHTLDQLELINNASDGLITLADYSVNLVGTGAKVAAALTPTFGATYTGNVTITDANYTVAQLKTINNSTSGDITLDQPGAALSGLSADVAAALAGTITTHTGTVTLTNAPNVAQLKAINAATTGNIVLQVANGALGGTAADLAAAFDGTVTTHTGTVTITDAPTVAQLKKINLATTGNITLQVANGALSGTAADLVDAFAGTVTQHTGTVTVTDAPNLAQLKAINAATDGAITLQVTNGALSGTAADLVAAFAPPITTHTGAVTITDQPSLGICCYQ